MMTPKRRKTIDTHEDKHESSELPPDTKNVVIFGESGVGKSSLINLIAGQRVCETSSGALGCTLEYQRHVLKLGTQNFAIWDTAGLDEGSEGTVPAEKAEAYLKHLLHALTKNHGVDLLVYCVRGTRIRSALLTNYHIFYSAICRKKVPIAIVVTGLENQEGVMESWWSKNRSQFSSFKMHFDNHACVTTIEPPTENAILKKRREESREDVIRMITDTCRPQQWNPHERSWIETAFSDIRAMLSSRDGSRERTPAIIMCDASLDSTNGRVTMKRSISFHKPISLSLSLNPFNFRSPVSISTDAQIPFQVGLRRILDRQFRVYQVQKEQLPSEGTEDEVKKNTATKRGVGLLIFCVKMETELGTVKSQWEHFSISYGGDLSPQIVVVVGASDQSSASDWWGRALGGTQVKSDADLAYWPANVGESSDEAAQKQLQDLITERCIDCSKVRLTRNEQLFRRSLALDMSNLTTLWMKDSVGKENGPPSDSHELDILTKIGVWEDVQGSTSPVASPVEHSI